MKLFLKISGIFFIVFIINLNLYSQDVKKKKIFVDTLFSNTEGEGILIDFKLKYGKGFNHPTFAIWLENFNGDFIQNLFVTEYIATGVFEYKQINDSTWIPEKGYNYRPAALPYWNHKRIEQPEKYKLLPDEINPIPDAYTGATPQNNFILKTRSDKKLPNEFRILMEINQAWDWNEFWTNNKFPDNIHYKTSSQPSLVYEATIDLNNKEKEYILNPIGHGHYAGEDGKLYADIETLTTAFNIIDSVKVIIKVIDEKKD